VADVDLNLDVAPEVAIYLVSYLRREYARGKRHDFSPVRRMRLIYYTGNWTMFCESDNIGERSDA